jgi:hypothetical protein
VCIGSAISLVTYILMKETVNVPLHDHEDRRV